MKICKVGDEKKAREPERASLILSHFKTDV